MKYCEVNLWRTACAAKFHALLFSRDLLCAVLNCYSSFEIIRCELLVVSFVRCELFRSVCRVSSCARVIKLTVVHDFVYERTGCLLNNT